MVPFMLYMVIEYIQFLVCIDSDIHTCHDTMPAYFLAGNLSVHVNPVRMSEPRSRSAQLTTTQLRPVCMRCRWGHLRFRRAVYPVRGRQLG